ncbi:MAG TPA: NUDIX domain-containing protein [Candidatus Saccharimonadales bacterium]|nr:NUDIX domain-containing protein [Candidatus Saccharimonadales bacterium]
MREFRCILHGSFGKHFPEIQRVSKVFTQAGIKVLAPKPGELTGSKDGFAVFADEEAQDPRLIELLYLHNLKRLGQDGFSYFVNVNGYIGKSAAYELGVAQLTNTRCFFAEKLDDHPAYIHKNAVWQAEKLAEYIKSSGKLPAPVVGRSERTIHKLWQDLMVPGSVVAAGAIIEHRPAKSAADKEVLLVKTHKWGGRYSIVGGKVRRNEGLNDALLREIKEETGLRGEIGPHIATFDQIKESGYYKSWVQHIFVDNIVRVKSKRVTLNEEAQDYIWARPADALRSLDIEPNARETLQLYSKMPAS